MKPGAIIMFVAGVMVGSVATNFFCQYNVQGTLFMEQVSKRWRHRSDVQNVSKFHESLDASDDDTKTSVYNEQTLPLDPQVEESVAQAEESAADELKQGAESAPQGATPEVILQDRDLIEEFRPLWSKIVLEGVYPPVNDGQPSVRAEPYPPDVCFSSGTPISKNWTLLSKTSKASESWGASAQRVLKPDPPKQPYRGHVKVCMHWNPGFWWQGYWREFGTCAGDDYCDLPCGNIHCRYSWRRENWNDCSAVILHHHLDSYVGDAPYLRKVFTVTEPLYKGDVAETLSDQNKILRKDMDVIAHWHRSANVFLAAHNNQFSTRGEEDFAREMNFGYLSCPPRPEVAQKTCVERRMGVTLFNHGNCNTPGGFRETYVRELQRYIHVDAYADCLHNKERPNIWEWTFQQEMELRSNYKFALAFENELSEDWVTEKVFHGLAAGTVPVYYGTANVHEFLPCSNCVIEVSKFASAKELAMYLIFLDQNPDKYMQYHAWRSRPMRVPPAMEASKAYFYCGVCQAVADDIEGKLPHLEWGGPGRWWLPDPGRKAKPAPPTWAKGFGG